ncbi:MAG: HAMP domain-containing sensor histidine kinase, partial [Chitinophagaceae bacterium]
MRLQSQYSKATIFSSITVLVIAGIGYYFLLRYVLEEQLDEALKVEEIEILDYVSKNHSLPEATTYKDQRISFTKITNSVSRHFSTIKSHNPDDDKYELSRQLIFPLEINGEYYAAYVTKSQEEIEELIGLILLVTLGLIVLLGILLFFFNRFLLKRLWRPFYSTLSSIKNFNLNAPSNVSIQTTSIDEFNEMNASVRSMTERVVKDYLSLKNFTDHASHELQTPLAVINSKLDVLIQSPELSETSLNHIQSIYTSVNKMSRLCQSLLLLTKIENNQFSDKSEVNIKEVIENKLRELEEWIQTNSLTTTTTLNKVVVSMNGQLAETLVSNLIVNAIKHSDKNSTIKISTEKNYFLISNRGEKQLDGTLVFDRFWKSEYSEGTGLGLAIVKQICEMYGFEISYTYIEGAHQFR